MKYEAQFSRDTQVAREAMFAAEKADPTISTGKLRTVFKKKMVELGWVPSKGLGSATNYNFTEKVAA